MEERAEEDRKKQDGDIKRVRQKGGQEYMKVPIRGLK
jgi:hypothetical protein